jgi:DNA-binding transcriptional ArsR family regulator
VSEEGPPEARLDEQLAPLVSCRKTLEVFTILAERPASPKEIAGCLESSISAVSYHVRKLVRLRMVEMVEELDAGGTFEHIYRALIHPVVGNEEWGKLSVAERQRISIWIVQLILADAARSFDAALFDACSNNHLSRTPMIVDRKGFDEVAEIQDRALAEIFEVKVKSSERLAAGEEPSVHVVAAMMCFELPEEVRYMKIQEVPSTVPALLVRKSS